MLCFSWPELPWGNAADGLLLIILFHFSVKLKLPSLRRSTSSSSMVVVVVATEVGAGVVVVCQILSVWNVLSCGHFEELVVI